MSNISKTSASIKRKLSLDDYKKPLSQINNSPVKENAKTTKKQAKSAASSKKGTRITPAHTQDKEAKIKATYYIGERENKMLMALYVDHLKNNDKADKSALICKAIRLLYQKEK